MGKCFITISVGFFLVCTVMVQKVMSQSIDDLFTSLLFRDDDATDQAFNAVNKMRAELVDKMAEPAEDIIGKLHLIDDETRSSYVAVEEGGGNAGWQGRTSAKGNHEQVSEKSAVVSIELREGAVRVATAGHPTHPKVETNVQGDYSTSTASEIRAEAEEASNARVYTSEGKVSSKVPLEPTAVGEYSFVLFKPRVPWTNADKYSNEEKVVTDHNTAVIEVIGAPKTEHFYRTPRMVKTTSLEAQGTHPTKYRRTDTNTRQDISTKINNFNSKIEDFLRKEATGEHSILNIIITPTLKFTEEPYMFNTVTTHTPEF